MIKYLNLEKITAQNKQITIVCIIFIATLLLGYSGLIHPLEIQIQNNINQQIITRTQIQNAQRQIEKFQTWQKRWKNLEKNPISLKPQNNREKLDIAVALKNIALTLTNSQLTALSLIPEIANEKQNTINQQTNRQLTSQTFSLTAIGNYQQIANFFLAIQNSNLLSCMPTFTIKQANDINNSGSSFNDNSLIFNATLQLFAANHKKHRDKLSISRNPFNGNITAKAPLNSWESKDLQFIGAIKTHEDNKIWGIISDPSGQLHYVNSSMSIGAKHNKISQITDNAIITEDNQDNIYR